MFSFLLPGLFGLVVKNTQESNQPGYESWLRRLSGCAPGRASSSSKPISLAIRGGPQERLLDEAKKVKSWQRLAENRYHSVRVRSQLSSVGDGQKGQPAARGSCL